MAGMILQIQAEALDPSTSVSTLLRKVKVAAVKLNVTDALPWVDLELSGYASNAEAELPSYRKLTGTLKVQNPYHGLQPLHFANPKLAQKFSEARIGQALPEIESILATQDEGLRFSMSPGIAKMLMDSMTIALEPVLLLSRASVAGIVESVRNLIIEWSLEMEKAGVLGEGMAFSQREREDAAPATQQFIIQNVGVLGDVSGHAQVKNRQTVQHGLDANALLQLLPQIEQNLASLPSEVSRNLHPLISDLRSEATSKSPDHSKLREMLKAARTVCEGAAGNLIASGIIAQIGKLIG